MKSTRCHAAIEDGSVMRNVIVTYPAPSFDNCTVIKCNRQKIAIKPFECEVHSTDDFNGIIAIVPQNYPLQTDFPVRANTFTTDTNQLAAHLPHTREKDVVNLHFIPMQSK